MAKYIRTPKFPELATGQRYGQLIAIGRVGNIRGGRRPAWLFKCDCGKTKAICSYSVRSGATIACGCRQGGFHGKGGQKPSKSLSEARRNGATQYNTGKLCKNGHQANRWTCSSDCVECERNRQHYRNRLARDHGLKDWSEVIRINTSQDGRCAICRGAFVDSKDTHIDHCHKTKKVRGLLCRPCNHGLGLFRDNPEHLRAAALYLERQQSFPLQIDGGAGSAGGNIGEQSVTPLT